MATQYQDAFTIAANSEETVCIQELEQFLSESTQPCLIGSNGEIVVIPEPIYQVLCRVIQAMAQGKGISLAPSEREISTQEAANILNISRPYLIKNLLEQGKIPYTKVGNHRRIRFQDVMAYQAQRDQERGKILNEFTEFLQDEGFYDG